MTKPRITTLRASVLSYIVRNPGCCTADVDRACRTARGGHKWMYAAVDRMLRAGLLRGTGRIPGRGNAAGLEVTDAARAILGE